MWPFTAIEVTLNEKSLKALDSLVRLNLAEVETRLTYRLVAQANILGTLRTAVQKGVEIMVQKYDALKAALAEIKVAVDEQATELTNVNAAITDEATQLQKKLDEILAHANEQEDPELEALVNDAHAITARLKGNDLGAVIERVKGIVPDDTTTTTPPGPAPVEEPPAEQQPTTTGSAAPAEPSPAAPEPADPDQ